MGGVCGDITITVVYVDMLQLLSSFVLKNNQSYETQTLVRSFRDTSRLKLVVMLINTVVVVEEY